MYVQLYPSTSEHKENFPVTILYYIVGSRKTSVNSIPDCLKTQRVNSKYSK